MLGMVKDQKRRWRVLWDEQNGSVLASLVHRGGALGLYRIEVTLRQTPFQHQAGLASRCPQGIHEHLKLQSFQEPCWRLGHWLGGWGSQSTPDSWPSPGGSSSFCIFLLDTQLSSLGSGPEGISGSPSLFFSCPQRVGGPADCRGCL